MRKILKGLVILCVSVFIAIAVYAGIQFVHLKLWLGNEQIPVQELTRQQKEEDFAYLAEFAQEVYPFSEELARVKGVNTLSELSADYIKRAGETADNSEFLRLFLEYTERLRQAGHGGIQFPDYSLFTSYTFDIPKDVFFKSGYWMDKLRQIPYYAHPEVDILYREGVYCVVGNTSGDETNAEIGSIVEAVNGLPVDEWVKGLESVQPLLYDNYHQKVYTQHLFNSDPGKDVWGWDVTFTYKNGTSGRVFLKKIPGYKEEVNAFSQSTHVFCTKLQDKVGYIHIPNFYQENIAGDGQAVLDFLKNTEGTLEKLIIDVRGNNGGEYTYWLNKIVRPLIRQNAVIQYKTAVKKSFEARMNVRLAYYRAFASNHLLHPKSHYISSVLKTSDPALDPDIWNVYNITQKLSPADSVRFDGKIILLTDVNCISAGDGFASTMKQLGLATLAGNPTGGWGNHYISPVLFALPNSGLCFRSDVELAYNVDNRPTSIYGTLPNVYLEQTPYPTELTKEALVKDEWISWALQH